MSKKTLEVLIKKHRVPTKGLSHKEIISILVDRGIIEDKDYVFAENGDFVEKETKQISLEEEAKEYMKTHHAVTSTKRKEKDMKTRTKEEAERELEKLLGKTDVSAVVPDAGVIKINITQRYDEKTSVVGIMAYERDGMLYAKPKASFGIPKGGLYETLYKEDRLHGIELVWLERPEYNSGIKTTDLLASFQLVFLALGIGKDYEPYVVRASQLGLIRISKKTYENMSKTMYGEKIHFLLAHANAVKSDAKEPVATLGTMEEYGKCWGLEGEALIKAMLKFAKWGMPASTPSTIEHTSRSYPLKVCLVPEEELVTDVWPNRHLRYMEGLFIMRPDIKFYVKLYGTDKTVKLDECQLRYRQYQEGKLTVAKGLMIKEDDHIFNHIIKKFNLDEDCHIITGNDNIKLGSKAECQAWESRDIVFINSNATAKADTTIGRQTILLPDQHPALEIYRYWSWSLVKNMDGKRVRTRPIEVFTEAVKGDFMSWRHILLSKKQYSFTDFVSVIVRALFFPVEDNTCISGYRVPMYKTIHNYLANRLMVYLQDNVLRVNPFGGSKYLVAEPELDELTIRHYRETQEPVNPIIPKNDPRIKRMIARYASNPDYRWGVITHPVVGGQIQRADFVALNDEGSLVIWKPEMGVKNILLDDHFRASCKYHYQAIKDNDGDQIGLFYYKGKHYLPTAGFGPKEEEVSAPDEIPETEAGLYGQLISMSQKMGGVIGKLDNISTSDAVNRLIEGRPMNFSQLVKVGREKEVIIKNATRPGGKAGNVNEQELIDSYIDKHCLDSKFPRRSALFKATSNAQGVSFDEVDIIGATWVNGFVNNCKRAKVDLQKVHENGNVFMYEDIIDHVNSLGDKFALRMRPEDSANMMKFCQSVVSSINAPPSAKEWCTDRAKGWGNEYNSNVSKIIAEYDSGNITKKEKGDMFTDMINRLKKDIESTFNQRYPEGGTNKEMALLYTCALCGANFFGKGKPGAAFIHFPFYTLLELAKRWWADNPVLKDAEKAYLEYMQSQESK